MKPVGPIPPEYASLDALPWGAVETPCYVYDFAVVQRRIGALRSSLPASVDLHYAMKANGYDPLLKAVSDLTDGLDVASAGEMARALHHKSADKISFAGPGKRDTELEAAIRAGVTLNSESEGEVDRALAIGNRLGIAPRIAVRVNPDYELRGSGMKMGGRPSPFGVDAARVPALVRHISQSGADWRGFHIFAGSQSLDTQAIIETQAATLALAARLADEAAMTPPLVNIGGGFGIPYFNGDTPIDLAAIGSALGDAVSNYPDFKIAIELGRFLVGEAGVYLTRVVDKKCSQGETFAIVDGGLNHHLAATGNFGTVVKRNYPIALAHRLRDAGEEVVTIVGPLCTPLDRLADRISLPQVEIGDVIAIFSSGAYGASASPSAFLGHSPVKELLVNLS